MADLDPSLLECIQHIVGGMKQQQAALESALRPAQQLCGLFGITFAQSLGALG